MRRMMGMTQINLTKGKIAFVSPEDLPELVAYKWSYSGRYAHRKDSQNRTVYMHRSILAAPAGMEVDHINRDPLDNRRENLRLATGIQNRGNTTHRHNRSGLKGVSWNSSKNKWYACISINNKTVGLGRFSDKLDAAKAYNAAAIRHFGEFAVLNNV